MNLVNDMGSMGMIDEIQFKSEVLLCIREAINFNFSDNDDDNDNNPESEEHRKQQILNHVRATLNESSNIVDHDRKEENDFISLSTLVEETCQNLQSISDHRIRNRELKRQIEIERSVLETDRTI